jgi:hypothetical protein
MSQKIDDVRIELPLGWQVDAVPQPQTTDAKLIVYTLKVENDKGTLHLERRLKVDLLNLEQKYYPTLRAIYQTVRTGDEQQIVLRPGGLAAGN